MIRILLFFFTAIFFKIESYPSYVESPDQKSKMGDGSYLLFSKKIKKGEINSIFEIGSRDAKDAIDLSNYFRCHVFAFEANPAAIEICKKNIENNPNVTLIPLAVWNRSCPISFYQIADGNIGASSCFMFNTEAKNYPEIVKEGLTQQKITVEAIRLDEFLEKMQFDGIDLLCLDVQGAAFQVLESLGQYLPKIKYIIIELELEPIYSGEVLYQTVDKYLINRGFVRASRPLPPYALFGDVLYKRKDIPK